ncbi:MAG: replication initiator protein A [Lachnospiraceae bacterium]|nr:replication initiator protein A [Lachnospiraceae bacterium]
MQFLTPTMQLPPYMAFPRFLLDKVQLSETAKIIYMLLLDRARLSMKNDGWTDEQGYVFLFFPIKKLAETIHKSEMSVKTALRVLEQEELIVRKRQGVGLPNQIYVKIPLEYLMQAERNLSLEQTENFPMDRQETVCQMERKLSGNNKENSNNQKVKRGNKEISAYGSYENVFLSQEEVALLKKEVPNYLDYIEKLSVYMVSSGKTYSNHAAIIRSWALRENKGFAKRTYECKEGESL